MAAIVSVSSEALNVLIDEPPELSKLYLCLVSNMDYETCVVGITYRINDAYLRERLSVPTVNGRKGCTPTRSKVRSVLARMIKVSLLVNRGKHVFYLPFEAANFSGQKRYDHRLTEGKSLDVPNKSNSYEKVQPEVNQRYSPHLYNNINIENIGDSVERFAMSLDWKYNREWIKSYLTKRGDDVSKIDIDWIIEYQGHWEARAHIQKSQHEWDVHLANYLTQFIRNPDKFDQLNGLNEYKTKANANRRVNNQSAATGFIPPIPQYDHALPAYALRNGFPECADGKSFKQYRSLLQTLRTQRIDAMQSVNANKEVR